MKSNGKKKYKQILENSALGSTKKKKNLNQIYCTLITQNLFTLFSPLNFINGQDSTT
jgi:flagellar motor switch protein FliG